MGSLIKGITVRLYERTQTGVDAFNNPVYSESPVDVKNVLVSPAELQEITDELQLSGKRLVYTLCIPKQDNHNWQDRTVEFFGQKWRTFGFPKQWIPDMVPMDWNLKVKVERYG